MTKREKIVEVVSSIIVVLLGAPLIWAALVILP